MFNWNIAEQVMKKGSFQDQVDFWTGQVALGLGAGDVSQVIRRCMDATYGKAYDRGFDMGFSLGKDEKGRLAVTTTLSPIKRIAKKVKVKSIARKTKTSRVIRNINKGGKR